VAGNDNACDWGASAACTASGKAGHQPRQRLSPDWLN
jgi:hypothetical protein